MNGSNLLWNHFKVNIFHDCISSALHITCEISKHYQSHWACKAISFNSLWCTFSFLFKIWNCLIWFILGLISNCVFFLLLVFWEYAQRSKTAKICFFLQFSTETVGALLSPHPLVFKSWYSPSYCGFLLKMDRHREWRGGLWSLYLGPCCENTVAL